MRSLLFVCAVLAAANAAAVADFKDGGSNKLKSLEARVAKAVAAIGEIQSYWDNTVAPQRASFKKNTEDLEARVEALEGNKCGKDRFACGDGECVSDLAVCDGDKDCFNGHDEAVCDSKFAAGTVFVGHNVYDDTCSQRRPSSVKMVITGVKRYNYFKNILQVSANIILESDRKDVEEETSLPTKGYFSFAKNELVLAPPEDDRLGLTCKFYGSKADECSGHFVHEASGDSCASFTMNRE